MFEPAVISLSDTAHETAHESDRQSAPLVEQHHVEAVSAPRLVGPWAVGNSGAVETAAGAGELSAWNLGSLIATRQRCVQHAVTRTRAAALADQLDHYQVIVALGAGRIIARLDGRELVAERGQPLVLDLARSAELAVGEGEYVSVFVPHESLDEQLVNPRDLHGARPNGASALVLAEHLRSLTACLPGLEASQALHAAAATLHIVAAAMGTLPDVPKDVPKVAPNDVPNEAPRTRSVECLLLRQACRYIDLHLGEPGLSAADLCRAFRVSRAKLYRLFGPYGGVSAHIRERRLLRIREVLCSARDTDTQRQLARIAEAHGFPDAAHFSRAYRRHFGHCASQAATHRLTSGASIAPSSVSRDPLATWLRSLRA